MTPPQLAVVVPAFNEARRLTENLLTLLSYLQTYRPEAELIVVDDGSTDGTAQVAEELFARRPDVMARVLRFAVEPRQRPRRPRRSPRCSGADRALLRRRSLDSDHRTAEDRRTDRGGELRHRPRLARARSQLDRPSPTVAARTGRQGLQPDCAPNDRSSLFRHPVRLQGFPDGNRPADHRAGADRWLWLRRRIAFPRAARRIAHARGAGPLGSQRGEQGAYCARQLAHVCRSRELAHAGRGVEDSRSQPRKCRARGNPPRLCKDGEIFSKTIR